MSDQGQLELVFGGNAKVSYTVRALPSGAVLISGQLEPKLRVVVSLASTREFVLTTSAPVLAILSASGLGGFSGTHFFPQEDGRKFWGNRIVVIAPAFGQVIVFARDVADIEIRDSQGAIVRTILRLGPGQRALVPFLQSGAVYIVTSTAPLNANSQALIAVASTAGNGFTVVPPVPSEAGGWLEDCNNDLGTRFMFGTKHWTRGVVLAFNPGPSVAAVSLTTITDTLRSPTAGYQDLQIPPDGTLALGPGDLPEGEYELLSSNPLFLSAGDMEGAFDDIQAVGDDITLGVGARGLRHFSHTLRRGAVAFASEDNTVVQVLYNGVNQNTVNLNKSEFLNVDANQSFQLTANRPLTVQILGEANGFNDWATALRPALAFDTDQNGIDDFAEGSSCRSVAPDTDRDGLFDFEDTDDDNDCVRDISDADRTNASVPRLDKNANCEGPNSYCDPNRGTCQTRMVQETADGGVAVKPDVDKAARSYRVACGCASEPFGVAWLTITALLWVYRARSRLS